MKRTLRMRMPQWQGGNNPAYAFGPSLLAWLAPKAEGEMEVEVPVEPYDGEALPIEGGVAGRAVLQRQCRAAEKILDAYQPDRVIVFGGDCLVSQAPFAYLNERYGGKLGVLWLDAHPDVSTPEMHNHEHAMVLGNLLGHGDPGFMPVKIPLSPARVLYGGLQQMTPAEEQIVKSLSLRAVGPKALAEDSGPILDWLQAEGIQHLAIHFDLDVLDPRLFRSLLFSEPGGQPIDAAQGEMTLQQVGRLIRDVSARAEVVGFSIAEYLPWDAMNLRAFFESLPLFGR